MMTNAHMVDKLKARVDVLEEIGGSIGAEPKIFEYELYAYLKDIRVETSHYQAPHTTESQMQAREGYLAAILLSAEDFNQVGGRLIQELKNDAFKGQSIFTSKLAYLLVVINDYSATASTPRSTNGY